MRQGPVVEQVAAEATERVLRGQAPFASREDEVAFAVQVLQLMGRMVDSLEGLERRLAALERRLEERPRARNEELEDEMRHRAARVAESVDPRVREQAKARAAADLAAASQRQRADDIARRLQKKKLLEDAPRVPVEWPFPDDTLHFGDYSIYMRKGVNMVPEPALEDVQGVIRRRLAFEQLKQTISVGGDSRKPRLHGDVLVAVLQNGVRGV